MEAYVITLSWNEYSERVAARCIKSAKDIGGIEVKHFNAIPAAEAQKVMRGHGLKWTWGKGCPITGLAHHSYGGDLDARIGCSMSHFALWMKCAFSGEPMMILEHDAVFLRPFVEFDFDAICMINDPKNATPRGDMWHDKMVARGDGVWPKTHIFDDSKPDGIAGNSAYVIKPAAALQLIELFKWLGVWPNDATMCRQLVPGLEEHYPFITKADAEMSTI